MRSLLGLNLVLSACALILLLNQSRQIGIFDQNGEILRHVIYENHQRLKAIEQYLYRALPTPSPLSTDTPTPTPTPTSSPSP